jgi:crotonobetainyl-CoA:carnitine CoA-transferase CaiB-like acyl-CoA transferase
LQDAILEGLTVIDLTQNVAGPFCTQALVDLGAAVIKVERPGSGDDTRAWRPPEVDGVSSTFLALNRGKKSICVDLDAPEGIEIVRRLATNADIFIHSMKPGSAESRGIGFEDLKALNPQLIYSAISAFGSTGPLSPLPGYDPLMQAFTGVMSTTGNEGEDPVRVGVSLIDMGTGMWATIGILAAALRRAQTGLGGLVEASLMDTGIGWMSIFVSNFIASGQLPKKLGSAMSMTAPYELFPAADGSVFLAAGNDRLFARVCKGLGADHLSEDPRFRTNPDRVGHRIELRAALTEYVGRYSVAEVVTRMREAGAPCSALNTVDMMIDNEQVVAAQIIRPLRSGEEDGHHVVDLPLKIDGRRAVRFASPPSLGFDTQMILEGLGYDGDARAKLHAAGTIG